MWTIAADDGFSGRLSFAEVVRQAAYALHYGLYDQTRALVALAEGSRRDHLADPRDELLLAAVLLGLARLDPDPREVEKAIVDLAEATYAASLNADVPTAMTYVAQLACAELERARAAGSREDFTTSAAVLDDAALRIAASSMHGRQLLLIRASQAAADFESVMLDDPPDVRRVEIVTARLADVYACLAEAFGTDDPRVVIAEANLAIARVVDSCRENAADRELNHAQHLLYVTYFRAARHLGADHPATVALSAVREADGFVPRLGPEPVFSRAGSEFLWHDRKAFRLAVDDGIVLGLDSHRIEVLRRLAVSDKDPAVRGWALYCLAFDRSWQARDFLLKRAVKDLDAGVRRLTLARLLQVWPRDPKVRRHAGP